ncbi:hypothetical protein O181_112496, partial [Austropuccinia psidii MF-1]|nr:hypothetical protein [Austropuccinia psidii MF-1]
RHFLHLHRLAISVWTVSACQENGDFTCGSSDNIVRVFTRSQERLAQHNELQSFEESVKASSVPSATVGNIKKTDLPSVMTLLSRKDIQDGVPPLKLPYNVSENPYTVAQKWLVKHQLPDSYVKQVVQFIDKNTSGVAIGSQYSGADPLTNSYWPNSSQAAKTSSIGQDPLTGYTSYQASGDGTHSEVQKVKYLNKDFSCILKVFVSGFLRVKGTVLAATCKAQLTLTYCGRH